MADKILVVLIVMGIPRMARDYCRRYRDIDGCRACYVLGQVQHGPLYWLLRAHLRRAGED